MDDHGIFFPQSNNSIWHICSLTRHQIGLSWLPEGLALVLALVDDSDELMSAIGNSRAWSRNSDRSSRGIVQVISRQKRPQGNQNKMPILGFKTGGLRTWKSKRDAPNQRKCCITENVTLSETGSQQCISKLFHVVPNHWLVLSHGRRTSNSTLDPIQVA